MEEEEEEEEGKRARESERETFVYSNDGQFRFVDCSSRFLGREREEREREYEGLDGNGGKVWEIWGGGKMGIGEDGRRSDWNAGWTAARKDPWRESWTGRTEKEQDPRYPPPRT